LPAEQYRKDVHAAANLTCTSCHNGDASAAVAAQAHAASGGKEFIARPASAAGTVAMCGSCHKEPAENFAKSPHALNTTAPRKPVCTTCHGSHGVQKASLELIAEPLCNSCHTIAQARRIHKALTDAERDVEALDEELAGQGPQAKPFRDRLKATRTGMRGLAHGLDLFQITRAASDALATVDEVRAKAIPQEKGRNWGESLRMALYVVALLVLIFGAVIVARTVWSRREQLPKVSATELKVVAFVGTALLVLAGLGGYKAKHYMDHDPKFCLSCHTMNTAFDLWQKSAHKNVDCHTCHIPNTISNLHQLYVYTTQRPDKVVKHAEIDRSICEKCHTGGGNESKWNQVLESAGHKGHVGKLRIECVQCHATSVHRFVAPKDLCATCHKQTTLKAAGTMAEMHCLNCHSFMTPAKDVKDPKHLLKPDRAACLDCHEKRSVKGETFPEGKTPMKWECGKCHKPHEQLNLVRNDCFGCHDAIVEGVHKSKGHQNCLDCHKPHGWSTNESTCTKCHTNLNPQKHHADSKKACTECHGAWDN
jgi:NapC/NirT cytochrome c family, N-terminal region/Cytochrome c3